MTNKAMKYGLMTIATVLLVAMAFAGAASATPDTTWYVGHETESEFILTTADQLEGLAEIVNLGTDNFTGKTIKLGKNIVLNDETYTFNPDTGLVKVTDGTHTAYVGTGYCGDDSGSNTYFDTVASVDGRWYTDESGTEGLYGGVLNEHNPIGTRTHVFSGNFDGCDYSISKMYINQSNCSINHGNAFVGLFGFLSDGSIKNLNLVDSLMNCCDAAGGNCGFILAETRWCDSAKISNCHSSGIAITRCATLGGVVGMLDANSGHTFYVDNCTSTAYIFANKTNDPTLAGIDAYEKNGGGNASITDCHYSGNIYYGKYVGGIIGYGGQDSTDVMLRCSMTGNLIGAKVSVGGIGTGYNGRMTDCFFSGNISTTAGSVEGLAWGASISNCYSVGVITSTANSCALDGLGHSGPSSSVSLLKSISDGSNSVNGRIGSSGSNNYAWEGMLINGSLVTGGTTDNKNGADVPSTYVWNNQSFFEALGWDFTNTWKMSTAENFKLPILQGMTEPNYDASYLAPIAVTFDTQGGSAVAAQTISKGLNATRPTDDPTKAGYVFENWYNESECTGVFDFAAKLTADTVAYANWTVNTTTVTASDNEAEFGNENITAIRSASGNVVKVLLETVMLVEDGAVVFIADNNSLDVPDLNGYTKVDDIAVFEINASVQDDHSEIVINVTFADAATATANKDKIKFFHYSTTNNDWDKIPLEILNEPEQDGANVTYQIQTTSFSPFGIGIYTAIPQQYTPSSSSKQTGSTVILQEGQTAPTAYATATPTVAPTAKPTEQPATPTVIATEKPTTQATQQSPAPFVGLLAGLGAAAVLLRIRK